MPATPNEGLRYTSKPVVPFVQMVLGLTGATSLYSNDEDQSYLRGSLGFTGQFGHFSRDFFDYTGFNLTYSQTGLSGQSPFSLTALKIRMSSYLVLSNRFIKVFGLAIKVEST